MNTDTSEAARRAQITVSRRRSPSERIGLAAEMSEAARRISVEGERRRNPRLTEDQARHVVFRLLWGRALAARVDAVTSCGR